MMLSQKVLYIFGLVTKHGINTMSFIVHHLQMLTQKKLLSKTSANGVEWLCQTCYKHLKNKVPPCAAINGCNSQ